MFFGDSDSLDFEVFSGEGEFEIGLVGWLIDKGLIFDGEGIYARFWVYDWI